MQAVATAAGLPQRLGKYELLLPLAAGGMARIYIGRSTGIGSFERHVVLKLITPERANDETAVQMFLDEARLAACLNHQNVAQVFEVGEEQGIHYLAMEYVHGQDLRALLAKAGSQGTRIPLELALTVVAGAAAGLNHAHERRGPDGTPLGIVHRDVSPSNIMIGYDGAVKLLDFGIAKATHRSVQTQSGIIKGKFAYMSPEQCRGRDVDRRSDVFSLGIILYEITTQHRCFRADSDFDTMHRIVTGDVVRPTRLVQGYPQALEAIVMKALAVDAAQRYQSAGLLLEALESFAVSARMSLSTMTLGRFMRDMFGEQPEPWLQANKSQPVMVKENTISSTDGSGSSNAKEAAIRAASEPSAGVPEEDPRFRESDVAALSASTSLDIQRGGNDERDHDEPGAGEWNARSYPSAAPSVASDETLPPDAVVRPATTSARHAAQTPASAAPQQLVPAGQFVPGPGSGSGPSIPAPGPVSTKHGYAAAPAPSRGDMGYPRYDGPRLESLSDVELRPSRRPLLVGLGVVAAGVIVMLVVSFSGGAKEPDITPAVGSGSATPGSATAPVGSAAGSAGSAGSAEAPPVDDFITIHIVSDPNGADVLIAGLKIGRTPYDGKRKRGSKVEQLVVRLAGYPDFTSKIDLSGDFSNDQIKLVKDEHGSDTETETHETGSAGKTPDPGASDTSKNPKTPVDHKAGAATVDHKNPATDHKVGVTPPTNEHKNPGSGIKIAPVHKDPVTPPKPKCQPPGAYNPFDTSCNGDACPPCKTP